MAKIFRHKSSQGVGETQNTESSDSPSFFRGLKSGHNRSDPGQPISSNSGDGDSVFGGTDRSGAPAGAENSLVSRAQLASDADLAPHFGREPDRRLGGGDPENSLRASRRIREPVKALPEFSAPPRHLTAQSLAANGGVTEERQATLWEAFTPTRPKDWSRFFAGRREIMQSVITTIEQDQANVIIFGARGIGKTSLANVLAESAGRADYQIVRCPCNSDVTFEDMFRGLLANLSSEYMDRSARAEAPTVQNFEQLLPRDSVNPTNVAQALSYLKLEHAIFIIDEFDLVQDEDLKKCLAETIKSLSDISARVSFIIVGIAQSLEDLIGKHPSIQRHVYGVHLPLMTPTELRSLINKGEEASTVRFDDIVCDMIVSFAKGLPYFAQLMCLQAGRVALERGSHIVELADLRNGLLSVLQKADHGLVTAYQHATSGEKNQFMVDVLFATASARFDKYGAFTVADAVNALANFEGQRIKELNFHKALSALTEDKKGKVIHKFRTPSSGTKYMFHNHMMRQYILLRQSIKRNLI